MILNRKILLASLLSLLLSGGFSVSVMASDNGQTLAMASVTITDVDKEIMSFLSNTKFEDWYSTTLENPDIFYDSGIDVYIIREQSMYILKSKLRGGGLPVSETTVTKGKDKVAITDFIQKANSGEITKLASITYSCNKNNGMLVITKIVLR